MNIREHFPHLRGYPKKAPLLLTVLLTACQHTEPHPAQAQVAAHLPAKASVFASGAVRNPSSAAALLRNLQRALTEPLLLSEELYEDEVLHAFFGGSIVEVLNRNPPNHFVFIRGLDYLPARERAQTQVGLRKVRATNAEPLTAFLSVNCSCELQLRDVDAVFGTTGRVIAEYRPPMTPHLPAPPPASNELGNLRVTYPVKTQTGYSSTLSAITDSIGNVRLLEARQWSSL
jgi:hypothetical protein